MPSRLFICARNAIDDAVLTGNPVMVSTLPVTNLQIPSRGRVARSTSAAVQEIKFTWNGSGNYLNFLTLFRHNLEPGATWRVQLYSDAAWTTQIYDSGTGYAYVADTLGDLDFGVDPLGSGIFDSFLGQRFSVVFFNSVLALSGKVTITDTGNSAGYVEASRLFAGDGVELTYNASAIDFDWLEDTTQSRSDGGSLRSDAKIAYRALGLKVDWIDSLQRSTFADMARYAGKRKDLFVSAYPQAGGELERDYTMLAKFKSLPKLSTAAGQTTLSTRFDFEET